MAPPKVIPTMGRDKTPVVLREDILDLQLAYDAQDSTLDDTGKQKKLAMQKLLWAFYRIQNMDIQKWNSYFQIAGFHGMPFRGAGWGNPSWWGGFCNHGNVLFPTWHRAYLVHLENALRGETGYDDIAIPYWDETGSSARTGGVPDIFLRLKVSIPYRVMGQDKDGDWTTDNPLRSYTFQDGIWDNLQPIPDADYSKPKGYETKRYPFSGLVGSNDLGATEQHNKFVSMVDTNKLLNDNVINWLGQSITISTGQVIQTNTYYKYRQCLNAPNYTVFSNTTSATQYNEDVYYRTPGNEVGPQTVPSQRPRLPVVPLESPHNDIHLAIGGFDIPGQFNVDSVLGANGDMGENDTAAFDPIFYFHHCFVDKVFWDWQKKWDASIQSCTKLEIEAGYPGTNSTDNQGPTPGVSGNTWLTMESPLAPFTKDDSKDGKPLTSNDVIDIVGQLHYKYYTDDETNVSDSDSDDDSGDADDDSGSGGGGGGGHGCGGACCRKCHCSCGYGESCGCGCYSCKLDSCGEGGEIPQLLALPPAFPPGGPRAGKSPFPAPPTGTQEPLPPPIQVVRVSGVNRAAVAGSFVLVVRAVVDGKDSVVGTESVLSRWKVSGCANCQTHLGVKAFVPLVGLDDKALSTLRVGMHTRGKAVDDLNSDPTVGGGWRIGNMEMPHGMPHGTLHGMNVSIPPGTGAQARP